MLDLKKQLIGAIMAVAMLSQTLRAIGESDGVPINPAFSKLAQLGDSCMASAPTSVLAQMQAHRDRMMRFAGVASTQAFVAIRDSSVDRQKSIRLAREALKNWDIAARDCMELVSYARSSGVRDAQRLAGMHAEVIVEIAALKGQLNELIKRE
jgi:hypothetical protein